MKRYLYSLLIIASVVILPAISPLQAQTNCPTPFGLAANSITTTGAQLSWQLPGPVGASFFNLQYRPSGTVNWTQVTSQMMSYSLANLNCVTAYEWRVQSVCANSGTGSTSPYSVTSIFTTLPCNNSCLAPTGLTSANVTSNSATLSWTGSGAPTIGYNLRYKLVFSPNWIVINNVTSPYQLQPLGCNNNYTWQVQAICAGTTGAATLSPWSTAANFTTPLCPNSCPAPTGLTSTNITTSGATLSWNAVAGAPSYIVRYRPAGSLAWNYTGTGTTTKTLSGLNCNTQYQWQVGSNCSPTSNAQVTVYSPTATFTTLTCPATCMAPTTLTVGNITSTSAFLAWNSTGVSSYRIRYAVAGSGSYTFIVVTGTSTTVMGLQPATAYVWQVQSICSNTNPPVYSSWSALNTFLTLSNSNSCATPTGLTATGVSQQGALLGWNAVTGALSYNIRYRTLNTTTWTSTTSATNSKQIGGLIAGMGYEFQVQTVCSGTNGALTTSAWSASAIFSTPLLMTIYPNPAGNSFNISLVSDEVANSTIEIRDLFGKVVYASAITVQKGSNDIAISSANLNEGLYNLIIINNGKVYTERLVISK